MSPTLPYTFIQTNPIERFPAYLENQIKRAAATRDGLDSDAQAPVWWNPDNDEIRTGLDKAPDSQWVCLKTAAAYPRDWLVPLGQTLGFKEGTPLDILPGWPSPLASMLTTGALGAGLGYGVGALAERFYPANWKKGRLRRTLAVLGGLGGLLPGIAYWGTNIPQHGFWDGLVQPGPWSRVRDEAVIAPPGDYGDYHKEFGKIAADLDPRVTKAIGRSGAFYNPQIPVDGFNNVVFRDPYTPPPIQAATAGLTTAAALERGHFGSPSPWVSPADLTRIAVGMGSGWLSGALVGKTLGALAGISPSAQERLQQAGVWAGILSNVIPMAFGR